MLLSKILPERTVPAYVRQDNTNFCPGDTILIDRGFDIYWIISRGLTPKELVCEDLWWNGPTWLRLPPNHWPSPTVHSLDLPESRQVVFSLLSDFYLNTTITHAYSLVSPYPHVLTLLFTSFCLLSYIY